MKTVWFIPLTLVVVFNTGCKTRSPQAPPPPPPTLPREGEPDSAYMAEWGASYRYYKALEENLKTYTKYSAAQRRRFYPFKRASMVYLAYFNHKDVSGNRSLPIKNGKVDLEEIDVMARLKESDLDSLTDILYNSGYREFTGSSSKMGCYYPRNAMLFADDQNNIFEYIEICFDCHQFRKSRNNVHFDPDNFTNHSLGLLEQFFNQQGLTTTGEED